VLIIAFAIGSVKAMCWRIISDGLISRESRDSSCALEINFKATRLSTPEYAGDCTYGIRFAKVAATDAKSIRVGVHLESIGFAYGQQQSCSTPECRRRATL
jgi:hypothetical protein